MRLAAPSLSVLNSLEDRIGEVYAVWALVRWTAPRRA